MKNIIYMVYKKSIFWFLNEKNLELVNFQMVEKSFVFLYMYICFYPLIPHLMKEKLAHHFFD